MNLHPPLAQEKFSTDGTKKGDRRRWDSNPRITVLQTVAFGRLATPPKTQIQCLLVYLPVGAGSRKFVEVLAPMTKMELLARGDYE